MRKHNWHHRDNRENQIIIQDLFSDWVNLKYSLALERAAAVTHLQTTMMLSSILHAWLRNFRLKDINNLMVWRIVQVMRILTALGTGGIPHHDGGQWVVS
jgi:hypothetical protein